MAAAEAIVNERGDQKSCEWPKMSATISTEAERLTTATSDTLQTLANEPSLGLYYVVEHIQRSVPKLVADKATLQKATEAAKGVGLDAQFAVEELDAAVSGATQASLANVLRLVNSSTASLDAMRHGSG